METLYLAIKIIFFLSLSLFLLGLWKPWVVLWWMPYQNRLMVIRYYGAILVVAGILLALI